MPTKRALLLNMLMMQQAHAMDAPLIDRTDATTKRQAYITQLLLNTIALPADIKRYIFQILPLHDLEFHDEFITRVKNSRKKYLPQSYYYKNMQEPEQRQGGRGRLSIPTGQCPYNRHVAVLNGNHLQIINTDNHSILRASDFFQTYQYPHCSHIALSGDTHTIATIHQRNELLPNNYGEFLFTVRDIIAIKNTQTKKTEEINIPIDFQITGGQHRVPEFAFNKEGTHLILRGVHDKQEQICSCDPEVPCDVICQDMPHHLILPLTINEHLALNKYELFCLAKKIWDSILPDSARKESQ